MRIFSRRIRISNQISHTTPAICPNRFCPFDPFSMMIRGRPLVPGTRADQVPKGVGVPALH
jgi:hypothetical protein